MGAKDLYKNICDELAESGIYLNPRDVHYLLYVIIKNIKQTCKDKGKTYLAKNKTISASLVGEDIKIRLNDSYVPKNKILRMADKTSNEIFNSIFLPSIIELLDSEED